MNLHVSYTWFLANMLHPFVMFFFFGLSGHSSGSELFGTFFSIFIYSLIFSLPSLFISFLFVFLISLSRASAIVKYISWIVVAPLVVILNCLLIFLLAGSNMTFSDLEIALPAMIAVVITVLIRHKQFFNLIDQLKKTKHENNLV